MALKGMRVNNITIIQTEMQEALFEFQTMCFIKCSEQQHNR